MANEVRLIDANALELEIERTKRISKAHNMSFTVNHVVSCIKNAPTVDAVEVVRCEHCKDGKSFIGARLLLGNDGEWHEINYCPNCGAKMDGDGQ